MGKSTLTSRLIVVLCTTMSAACATSTWEGFDTNILPDAVDTTFDTATDIAGDTIVDTSPDTIVDTAVDTDLDTATDTAVDTGIDTVTDTGTDTATDTGTEIDAPPGCGNGTPDIGEECDDGTNDGSYGTCNFDCTLASHCGDGTTDAGYEDCDDSGASSFCSGSCTYYTDELGLCDDGIDNDRDGPIDCADAECIPTPTCSGGGPILLFFEECGGGADNATAALTNLGLSADVTTVTTDADFLTQMTSGTTTWHMVIVDEYANPVSTSSMDALLTYYDAGGRIIFSDWELGTHSSHALLTRVGVTLGTSYSTPLSVYAWFADPLFLTPNAVPNLETFVDLCGDDGFYTQATTGTAVAGYTTADAYNQTAITIGPADQMILNAFAPQNVSQDADSDTVGDMVELYENQITYLY